MQILFSHVTVWSTLLKITLIPDLELSFHDTGIVICIILVLWKALNFAKCKLILTTLILIRWKNLFFCLEWKSKLDFVFKLTERYYYFMHSINCDPLIIQTFRGCLIRSCYCLRTASTCVITRCCACVFVLYVLCLVSNVIDVSRLSISDCTFSSEKLTLSNNHSLTHWTSHPMK